MVNIHPLLPNVEKVEFVDVTKENKKVSHLCFSKLKVAFQIVEGLNNRIFPIVYQPFFYKEIIHHGKKDFNKLVNLGSSNIGVILCKLCYLDDRLDSSMKLPEKFMNLLKPNGEESDNKTSAVVDLCDDNKEVVGDGEMQTTAVIKDSMIYISALGLIPTCRGQGIGKLMMQHVLELGEKTPGVKYIGLHVQVGQKIYKRGKNVSIESDDIYKMQDLQI